MYVPICHFVTLGYSDVGDFMMVVVLRYWWQNYCIVAFPSTFSMQSVTNISKLLPTDGNRLPKIPDQHRFSPSVIYSVDNKVI